jgi:hypothetical protein
MKPEADRSEGLIMGYFWDPERETVEFNVSATRHARIAELVERGYEASTVKEFYCSARPMLARIIQAIKNGFKQIK